MIKLSHKYPEFQFDRHVGYGTTAHKKALLDYGICPEHRQSFRPIRQIMEQRDTSIIYDQISPQKINPTCTTSIGQNAESDIIKLLQSRDHTIIAHNYKTKSYEIDIISTFEDKIYFTEVKFRQNLTHGTPLEQITSQKHAQMSFAAQDFLSTHPEFTHFQPILAAGVVSGSSPKQTDWTPLLQ